MEVHEEHAEAFKDYFALHFLFEAHTTFQHSFVHLNVGLNALAGAKRLSNYDTLPIHQLSSPILFDNLDQNSA